MTTDITELAQSHELRNKVNHRLYGALEFQGTSGEHATVTLSIDECKSIIAAMDERLALVEALEKAQQEAEELSKFKEVMTSAANALKAGKPLNLESLFKGELASAMFAMMFAGEFVRSGATNYLELLYEVPEFGEMTVTLQKVEGKTPGQRIAELESRSVNIKFAPIPVEELGNVRDGKKHPYMFGAGYNSAVIHCESVIQQELDAKGIRWEAE